MLHSSVTKQLDLVKSKVGYVNMSIRMVMCTNEGKKWKQSKRKSIENLICVVDVLILVFLKEQLAEISVEWSFFIIVLGTL